MQRGLCRLLLSWLCLRSTAAADSVARKQDPSPTLADIQGCFQYRKAGQYWSYQWCNMKSLKQYRTKPDAGILLGRYVEPIGGNPLLHRFDGGAHCPETKSPRQATVAIECCRSRMSARNEVQSTYITSVSETSMCKYHVKVCTVTVCEGKLNSSGDLDVSKPMSEIERIAHREGVRNIFYHAYDNYMRHGFPADEVKPLTCRKGKFNLGSLGMLTLVDALDTLVIMGNRSEFRRAVDLVVQNYDFNMDVNVSVFETNIRVLGGLLSAHSFASDPNLSLYDPGEYKGGLLKAAVSLGDRLLPAFRTKTGIPYGTVNLRHGVPINETLISSTAGAGTLTMEFCILSAFTGDMKYASAALVASRRLYQFRSSIGLVGKHISIKNGNWYESTSGIGSNGDSFFEYMLKMYMLFGDQESYLMFMELYHAVEKYMRIGDWYADVDMHSGRRTRLVFDSLQAFWPGVQVLLGDIHKATRTMNAFFLVWRQFGAIPEQFNFGSWGFVQKKGGSHKSYPLRPELAESTMYMYRATRDPTWLWAGKEMVVDIQLWSKAKCGYATVADVEKHSLEDSMPSYFLSETLKYLYLLFDDQNFIHNGNYVFTTEGHPFDAMQINQTGIRTLQVDVKKRAADSLQCTKRQPYSPPFSFDPFHVDDVGNVTSKKAASFNQVDQLQCPGPSESEADVSQLAQAASQELEVAGLGKFKVTSFADGFHVSREEDQEVIEVSNIGNSLALVNNQRGDESQFLFVDRNGVTVQCRVSTNTQPRSQADGETGTTYDAPCSPAMFGPTSSNELVPEMQALLETATPLQACAPLESSKEGDSAEGDTSGLYEGKVVLAERGDCMFEEKARFAQQAGAAGIIIINNVPDQLFIMAGSLEEETPEKNLEAVQIPAVMVSKEDGEYLKTLLADDAQYTESQIMLSPHVSTLEDPVYVSGGEGHLQVLGMGEWGIHIREVSKGSWQLFIIQRKTSTDDETKG